MKLMKFAAVLVSLAIVLGSCGDSQDEVTAGTDRDPRGVVATGSPLEEGQFLRLASALCAQSRAEMLARVEQERLSFGQALGAVFLTGIQFWYDDIKYLLVPPRDEVGRVEAMLDAMKFAVRKSLNQRISSAEQLEANFSRYNELARGYGLEECFISKAALLRAPGSSLN